MFRDILETAAEVLQRAAAKPIDPRDVGWSLFAGAIADFGLGESSMNLTTSVLGVIVSYVFFCQGSHHPEP